MSVEFWGKGQELTESHFYLIGWDGLGRPACYPSQRVTNIVSGKKKPVCGACVQLRKLQVKPKAKGK